MTLLNEREIQEALFVKHIEMWEELDSIRGPGWYYAECTCRWYTTGHENVVEDAAYDHVFDNYVAPILKSLEIVETLLRDKILDAIQKQDDHGYSMYRTGFVESAETVRKLFQEGFESEDR